MSNVEDILAYAWDKNAADLKSAVALEMGSRVSAHIDNMYADVAASVFGNTSANEDDTSLETETEADEGFENEEI
jgi:hypothetical protein